jgi:cytochrome b561
MSSSSPRHSLTTRFFHASLAGAVIVQLLSSVWMRRPRGTEPGNILFPIHEYAGMVALALAFLFWVTVLRRRVGTAPGALIPWFSAERLRALWADVGTHLRAARAFTLPPHQDHAALPSAIHGLGLLLISYMAVSGTYWYLMSLAGLGRSIYVKPFLELHGLFGNVVWAYLIGHAALALLHHVTKNLSLGVMWSLKS